MARSETMGLNNLRPQFEAEDEFGSAEDGAHDSPADEDSDGSTPSARGPGDEVSDVDNEDHDEDMNGDDNEAVAEQISRTSFGALKQAQAAVSKKRKRGLDSNEDQEAKLAAIRSRLKDVRAQSGSGTSGVAAVPTLNRRRESAHSSEDNNDPASDTDSAPSEVEAQPWSRSRTSKHAPAAQSSKYQVTRKRSVIHVPKPSHRDPRFDALNSQPSNLKDNSEKAYAFLDDYQKSEIKELRGAIKATKDEDEKETLRRKMVSMENKLKSKAARERERDVVRKHRREERDKIEQGKQPYYLKQKDIKQKALEDKFKGMKGKEREKVMERRRKKEGQKEKKRMPMARRVQK